MNKSYLRGLMLAAGAVILIGANGGIAIAAPSTSETTATQYGLEGATPYSGAAITIPAVIEAEDFDYGGQGLAYHDNVVGNAGGQYRIDEDVDIVVSLDDVGTYDVNNFESGEWLGYTIQAESAGHYEIDLRAASAFSDSAYRIELDGQPLGSRVGIPNTSGWQRYEWVGQQTVSIGKGTHFLKIVADQQYFNLNSIRLTRVSLTSPYHGAPASLPGVIEAEDFDFGGEGAAYHDKVAGNAGGQYRSGEDVDIVLSSDPDGGTYDVNNFETGEWLAYTVNIAGDGDYDIALRVASGFDSSAFHVEIDDVAVTGKTAVLNTGGWSSYQWVVVSGIPLSEGSSVLKVVADEQYFNFNSISVQKTSVELPVSSPWGGTAAVMPGTVSAADFDVGGEGLAYHDTTKGNAGGAYRPDEDVDIVPAGDTTVSAYSVNNFQTGEWLSYSIDVIDGGEYDVAIRAASAFDTSAVRIEIDGQDVGGSIAVPNTGSWNSYQWVGANAVSLQTGQHVVRVTAQQEYFNMNALRIQRPVQEAVIDPQTILFSCTFPYASTDCGFREQSKTSGRTWTVNTARDGNTGILLRTESGDTDVAGSGSAERTDLWLTQAVTDGYEGREGWWAHSIMFPDNYVVPPSGWGVAFDFHNTSSGAWQANFHVDAGPNGLAFRGYGGTNSTDGYYGAPIGPVQRNVWYDFVYHVKWSSGSDGYFDAWVNGKRVLAHRGPTLYSGQGVYLKLANYHSPFGQGSSIIHDRVIHGTTPQAVSDRPLEGVLEVIDGVLKPVL